MPLVIEMEVYYLTFSKGFPQFAKHHLYESVGYQYFYCITHGEKNSSYYNFRRVEILQANSTLEFRPLPKGWNMKQSWANLDTFAFMKMFSLFNLQKLVF